MSLDQLHEQNNRTINSSVASSFANRADDSTLIRWETCGAELSRIINEFENTFRPQVKSSSNHHEDCISCSFKFYSDIKTLYEELPVNPFMVEDDRSLESMIHQLCFLTKHLSQCQQSLKMVKNNFDHLCKIDFCTKRCLFVC